MKRLAFFVGSDISSWLICHDVVSRIHSLSDVTIFFPKHKAKKPIGKEELVRLGIYERKVLAECIFPLLSEEQSSLGNYAAPALFCRNLKIKNVEVDDINDAAFFSSIKNNFDGVISLRCYQKFSSAYVDHFSDNRILWNLHPGDLPAYRGVMTCFRAMQNGETEHAFTLHKMGVNWDSGDIVGKAFVPLDMARSFLSNMLTLYSHGSSLLINNIMSYLAGQLPQSIPQDSGCYWHFPEHEELLDSLRKGIKLVDHEEIKQWYRNLFFSNVSLKKSLEFSNAFDSYINRSVEPIPEDSVSIVSRQSIPKSVSHNLALEAA